MARHPSPEDPMRAAACRALMLTPPPQPPAYAPSNLDTRRLRLLAMWDSEEALKLARAAGLEVPHAHS